VAIADCIADSRLDCRLRADVIDLIVDLLPRLALGSPISDCRLAMVDLRLAISDLRLAISD
jgi:hypothetical protein